MSSECLICSQALKYLDSEEMMKCAICGKTEKSATACINKHYVCNECHTQGIDLIFNALGSENSKNPIKIFKMLISLPFCHMHGPEHHILVGAALLCAYKNAGGKIDLTKSLVQLIERAKKVPGGACGFWGACGAGISSGMFISIVTGSTPLKNEEWGLSNKMTSLSLGKIGEIGGPRCCKRNSYTAIISAVEFARENLKVQMELPIIKCEHQSQNNQCIGTRCPYFS
ncbi:MAG: SAM-dependent methyltransferase [Clostridia bacterium]|nr:SAM-dependent methyltransferase [Clostridia bacterium]